MKDDPLELLRLCFASNGGAQSYIMFLLSARLMYERNFYYAPGHHVTCCFFQRYHTFSMYEVIYIM